MLATELKTRSDRGPVQCALLALLAASPRHGYELHDLFEAALGGHWSLNTGQIYSSLDRLARDGLIAEAGVEKGGGPEKRLWALTAAGSTVLRQWFGSAVPREYRLRDELFLKLVLAIASQAAPALEVLQVQRRELFQELHGLTVTRNAADPNRELARILLLESAIMHTEAELRWLEIIEARLDAMRAQPPPPPPPRPRGRPRKAAGAVEPEGAPPSGAPGSAVTEVGSWIKGAGIWPS